MTQQRATKIRARALFGQGWGPSAIAAELSVPEATVRYWRDVEGWTVTLDPEQVLENRLAFLLGKEGKTQAEWRELKQLNELRHANRARAEKTRAVEEKRRAKVSIQRGETHRRKDAQSNDIGHIDLKAIERPPFCAFQQEFLDDDARLRWGIKSRQIGFTWLCSWEALEDAIATGRDQIFLSASKAQAQVFRDYMVGFAADHLTLKLKSSKEKLPLYRDGKLWATLRFLSTNTATAQSYHGNVYIDEACWIPQFAELYKVAGGMASQVRFRRTIISTPSTVAHPAWQEYKRLREQGGRHVSIHTLTVYDAIAGGLNDGPAGVLLDPGALREVWGDAAFRQLYLCEPLDDEESIFKLRELEALQSDPAIWKDPHGVPVWLGYDPSRFRDSASLVLVAKLANGRRRVFRRESWQGKSYRWQVAKIREYWEHYDLAGVAIDTSGMGQAVYELVREFVPRAKLKAITYTIEVKNDLVQTLRDLVQQKQIELPAGDTFLLNSFLAIKQQATGGGRITYRAGRTASTGHADSFFAVAHACAFEPLRRKKRRMITS